ncbi:hypothetical protein QL285_071458 [Trifolium repens]|nr:hypothetical protein QL285_071458 [Trifolium repens]
MNSNVQIRVNSDLELGSEFEKTNHRSKNKDRSEAERRRREKSSVLPLIIDRRNTLHLKSHINQRLTKNVDQVRGKNKGICGNNETFPMKNQSFLVPNSQHLANELSAIFLASMSSRGKNGYSSLFTIS